MKTKTKSIDLHVFAIMAIFFACAFAYGFALDHAYEKGQSAYAKERASVVQRCDTTSYLCITPSTEVK